MPTGCVLAQVTFQGTLKGCILWCLMGFHGLFLPSQGSFAAGNAPSQEAAGGSCRALGSEEEQGDAVRDKVPVSDITGDKKSSGGAAETFFGSDSGRWPQ